MDNKLPISFSKSEISKSSPNIIDLIEVGDYVNGNPVCLIKEDEINYLIDEVNKLKEKKNLKCSNNYDIIKKKVE